MRTTARFEPSKPCSRNWFCSLPQTARQASIKSSPPLCRIVLKCTLSNSVAVTLIMGIMVSGMVLTDAAAQSLLYSCFDVGGCSSQNKIFIVKL